jgi:hypothetical protein
MMLEVQHVYEKESGGNTERQSPGFLRGGMNAEDLSLHQVDLSLPYWPPAL